MAISPYTQRLVNMLNTYSTGTGKFGSRSYAAIPGAKRDRVTWGPYSRPGEAVRCFVDRETGVILYAAGWAKPAQWKTGPATEFGGSHAEHLAYAAFTRLGGWGYRGDRAALAARIADFVGDIDGPEVVCPEHDIETPALDARVIGHTIEYRALCWAGEDGPHDLTVTE